MPELIKKKKPKKVKGIIHWVSADPKYSTKVKYIIYNDVMINKELNQNSKEEYIGYLENYAIMHN